MSLKTSLIITGDASVAKREVDGLAAAVDDLAKTQRDAAKASAEQDRAQTGATASTKELAASDRDAAGAARDLTSATRGAATVTGTAAAAIGASGSIVREHTRATNDNVVALRSHGSAAGVATAAITGVSGAMRDGASVADTLGNVVTSTGTAMAGTAGTAGRLGAYMLGPWGVAITVGAEVVGTLVGALLDTDEKSDAARESLADLGKTVGDIGTFFSRTTGKIEESNRALVQFAILSRQKKIDDLRTQQVDAAKTGDQLRRQGRSPRSTGTGTGGVAFAASATFGGTLSSGDENIERVFQSGRNVDAQLLAIARGKSSNSKVAANLLEQRARFANTGREISEIDAEIRSLQTGTLAASLRTDSDRPSRGTPRRTGTGTAERRGAANDNAFPRASDPLAKDVEAIARINAEFDRSPTLVDKAAAATRRLDGIVADLGQRQPPGFEKLIADAGTARAAIAEGVNRPLDEFLAGQAEQLRQGDLIIQGRMIEAEAARAIVAIERQRGKLLPEQKAEIVASVVALRQQERQLERNRALQQINLSALQDMREIVTQTIYDGPQSLADLPGRVFESFKRFSAEKISEEFFGEMFRDMRDQVLGANKVDAASNVIVASFGRAAASAEQLAGSLAGAGAAKPAAPAAGAVAGTSLPAGVARAANDDQPVVVTGRRQSEIYGDTIAKVLTKVGIGKDTSADIGKNAGKALAGAFEGQMAAGAAGLLGIKTSGTGSAIGGAIGGLTGLPGGSIIGGLAGGLIGGLFGQKKASGTATITGQDGVSATGTARDLTKGATGLAGSVQDGLDRIAEQLGGSVGKYLVSIGTYDGDYRVSTSGQGGELSFGKKNKSKSTLHDFGDDQSAAIAFAITDAIADGAVTGVSAAVRKALASSSDLDDALKDALGVAAIERAIGGTAEQYRIAFDDVARQAANRVDLARKYGLDLVAVEKLNGEERVKLTSELTRAQVGSLQTLVDEITRGSLFEGSALDRIAVLNSEIARAKGDLEAGKEGAGDTLADLYGQRLEAAKAAYGTTTGFSDTRNATLSDAQAAIARVNAQIVAAQAKSDPALKETNEALDENNDQNARIIAALEKNNTLMEQLAASGLGGRSVDLGMLARMAAV